MGKRIIALFPFLTSSKLQGMRFLLRFRKKFDCSIKFYPSNRRDYNLAACIVGSPVRIGHRCVIRDLAGKMNVLLGNQSLRQQMGKKAREYAKDFTWDKIAEEYEKFLMEIVKKT